MRLFDKCSGFLQYKIEITWLPSGVDSPSIVPHGPSIVLRRDEVNQCLIQQ